MPKGSVNQKTIEKKVKKSLTKVVRDTAEGVAETTYYVIPKPSRQDCIGIATTTKKG